MIHKKYYYLMFIITVMGNFTFYVTPYLTINLFNGGLMAIPLGLLLFLANNYWTIRVFNYYKNYTIVEINRELLGKVLGDIISMMSVILNLLSCMLVLIGTLVIFQKFLLPNTSIRLLMALLFIPLLLSLLNTDKSFLYLLSYLSLYATLGTLLYYIFTFSELRLDYLKGIINHSIKLPSLTSICVASYYYIGLRNLQLFNPNFEKISYKGTALFLIFIAFPMGLINVLIPSLVWGPLGAKTLEYPWVSTTDTISINLFVIERGFYLLMPLFLILGSAMSMNYFFIANKLFQKIVTNGVIIKISYLITILAFFIASIVIKDTRQANSLGVLTMTAHVIFNTIMFLILFFLLKRKEKKSRA